MENAPSQRILNISDYVRPDSHDKFSVHTSSLRQIRAHCHRFFEIMYVRSGTAQHILNCKTSVIKANDYMVLDYNDIHSYICIGPEPLCAVNVLFTPDLFSNSIADCREFATVLNYCLKLHKQNICRQNLSGNIFHDSDGEIAALIGRLEAEAADTRFARDAMAGGIISEIFIQTVRKNPAVVIEEANGIVSSMIGYVEEHIFTRLSMSELSASLGYCLPYLSRTFKKEMGCTFTEYIQRRKIRKACELLLEPDRGIGKIAEQLGYSDSKHFSELFRKYVGCSPRAFISSNNL